MWIPACKLYEQEIFKSFFFLNSTWFYLQTHTPLGGNLPSVILRSSLYHSCAGVPWTIAAKHQQAPMICDHMGRPRWRSGKELACHCRRCKRCGFNSWAGKTAWRRRWQPTPVFLPGKSHGQRSLDGYRLGSQRVGQDWAHIHLPS